MRSETEIKQELKHIESISELAHKRLKNNLELDKEIDSSRKTLERIRHARQQEVFAGSLLHLQGVQAALMWVLGADIDFY